MCSSISTTATCADGVASDDQIAAVQEKLESPALQSVVSGFEFESREEAYQAVLDLYGQDYAEFVTEDQLNEAFRINLVDPTRADVISEAFGGMEGVEGVQNQMQYLDPLFSALTVATYIAVGIAVLMLIAAVLLIATTIRLSAYARRRELGIMRLVGASNRFIQTPFILEGMFAALIGSVLASAAIVLGVQFGVNGYLRGRVEFVTTWVGMSDAAIVIPTIIAIGLVLAAVSAGFAIRRWLRA
jgi:cell division transport system permease protein